MREPGRESPDTPGYYWLRSRWSRRWCVACYLGKGQWQFLGVSEILLSDEVLADVNDNYESYEIGGLIKEPCISPGLFAPGQ